MRVSKGAYGTGQEELADATALPRLVHPGVQDLLLGGEAGAGPPTATVRGTREAGWNGVRWEASRWAMIHSTTPVPAPASTAGRIRHRHPHPACPARLGGAVGGGPGRRTVAVQ